MTVKDKTVSWFIRNVLLPRNEIIDRPGFIVLKMGKKMDITNLVAPPPLYLIPGFIWQLFLAALPWLIVGGIVLLVAKIIEWLSYCRRIDSPNRKP